MSRWRRRLVTVPAVAAAALALTVTAPLWIPLALLADAVRLRWRMPVARLLAFAWCWAWLECTGVAASAALWLGGRSQDRALHYRLQRWWLCRLMGALRVTCGVAPEVTGADELRPGPTLLLCRHASLADSLVSAWAVTVGGRLRPRYVLKRELLSDPCLDVVGQRLPNHFLDRAATDTMAELLALRDLVSDLGPEDVAVIFPEGTRANDAKRERALERIGEREPDRAARLAMLTHLLPPRPAGTLTLLDAAPDVDVAVAWHTGFDGFDSFGRILRRLAHPLPRTRFVIRRIPRDEVPEAAEDRVRWLDAVWLELDGEVRAELSGART